jgi:hypothetical protein
VAKNQYGADNTRFYNFSHPIGEFSSRQRFKECGVDEYVFWLPESSDEILAMLSINRCFPSDTGIDHG